MSRFTQKDLESNVIIKNMELVNNGKPFYFMSKPRRGYNAIDVHEANSGKCIENIVCGSAFDCNEVLHEVATALCAKRDYYPRRSKTFTREGALRAAIHCGIDFTQDVNTLSFDERNVHTLYFDEKDVLNTLAVKTRFYKSRHSKNSLSRASCFFVHLSKIQAKEGIC